MKIIYSAINIKTGETIEGRSKDLMQAIGCKHNDPHRYAKSNSIYKNTWKIVFLSKAEKAEKENNIDMSKVKVDCFGYDKTKHKCKVLKNLECTKKECKFYKSKKNIFKTWCWSWSYYCNNFNFYLSFGSW